MSYGLPQLVNCKAPPVSQCSMRPNWPLGPGAGGDATDVVNTRGERPVVSLEGLRQSTGHCVLFEHQHALAAARAPPAAARHSPSAAGTAGRER
jgi:hypothetical protein